MKYVIPPNFALLCLFWSVKYAIPASFLLWSVLLLVCKLCILLQQVLICEVCYSSHFWSVKCACYSCKVWCVKCVIPQHFDLRVFSSSKVWSGQCVILPSFGL